MTLADNTIGSWLDGLAANAPTPGGGAAAPLVGAIASALGAMTVAYARSGKGPPAHQALLDEASAEFSRARAMFLELAEEDAVAYRALSEALALPKDDPSRRERVPKLALIAMQVPLNTIATCAGALSVCERLAPLTNRSLKSDLLVASIVLEAGARAAREIVSANEALAPAQASRGLGAEGDRLVVSAARALGKIRDHCATT